MKTQLFIIASLLYATFSSAQIHFHEDFETRGFPVSWTEFSGTNGYGTNESWKNVLHSSGARRMSIKHESVPDTSEDWLVTPLISLGSSINQLSFDLKNYYGVDYGSIIEVKVSTTSQTSHSSFTTIKTYLETDYIAGNYTRINIDLSVYNNQQIYIAFVVKQKNGDDYNIDNVSVYSPSCSMPSNLSTSQITSSSAQINWSGNNTSYQIKYIQGSFFDNVNYISVNDSSYTFNNLLPNATIIYNVREICPNGDTSVWSQNSIFTTDCNSNFTLPYTQDFNDDTLNSINVLPCGWTSYNINHDFSRFEVVISPNPSVGSIINLMYCNHTSSINDWVLSPEFNLSAGTEYTLELTWNLNIPNSDSIVFAYGKGQHYANQTNIITKVSNFNCVLLDTSFNFTPDSSGNFSISISAIQNQSIQYINIDNFKLSVAQPASIIKNTKLNVNIFPNPSNGEFTIANKENEAVNIIIKDVQGKVVKTINNLNGLATKNVSIENVKNGIYFVTIKSINGFVTKRITVK